MLCAASLARNRFVIVFVGERKGRCVVLPTKQLNVSSDNSAVGFQEQLTAGPGVGQRAADSQVRTCKRCTYYNKCDNMLSPIPDRVLCDV